MTSLRTLLTPRQARSNAATLTADALLATAVGVGTALIDAFGPDNRTVSASFWDVVLAIPLAVRRRTPGAAAALIGALCLAQWSADVLATGDFVMLIMLYSLGAWEPRRWLLATAIAIAELGVIMAVVQWAPRSHAWLTGLMMTGTITASWVVGRYVRERRAYLSSMVERAQTAERDRDSRARVAVAVERARMAREMHDIVAHSLSVMITLNDAAAAVADLGQVRRTVKQASDVGRQALAEMQRLLGVLRSDEGTALEPQPDTSQLSDLVGIVRSAGLAVELTVTGDLSTLPSSAQLSVYRIVQESLTNVLKHAHNVGVVSVTVTHRGDAIEVQVDNDGDRVNVPEQFGGRAGSATSHGVAGMRERTALWGGHLSAGPKPAGGWLVTADLSLMNALAPQ